MTTARSRIVGVWRWYEGEFPFFARFYAWFLALGVPVFGGALFWRWVSC